MTETYVAFLRGINLGKRRVKNDQLLQIFTTLGFEDVKVLIASGNVIFGADQADEAKLTAVVEEGLATALGFRVDTMLRRMSEVQALLALDPFKGIEVTKQTRLYVTLLAATTSSAMRLPWDSPDGAFRILSRTDREVFSVLSLAKPGQTVDVMAVVEREFGKRSTTRNWNTIVKLGAL